jgi:hypothetical protein
VRAASGNKGLVMNNSPLIIPSGLEKQSNLHQPRFVGRSVSVGLGLQCVYFVREGGSSILRGRVEPHCDGGAAFWMAPNIKTQGGSMIGIKSPMHNFSWNYFTSRQSHGISRQHTPNMEQQNVK